MGTLPRIDSLDEIEDRIWTELADAAGRPASPEAPSHEWRTMVLATLDGQAPDARTLVLREVDPAERRLVFYTDARSPKVRQIESSPTGALLCWSRALDWQLRMPVRLAVETSGLAVSSRWARLQTTARAVDYRAPHPPGDRIGHPAAGAPAADAPGTDLGSRSHFAMITALIEEIDWLELHPDGHRRALFGPGGGHWVQP